LSAPSILSRRIGGGIPRTTWRDMRPLIAVISCHKNMMATAAQRVTWADPKYPIKFFYGSGSKRAPLPDEVFLDVPDTYVGLPYKVQAVMQWAKEHGFTEVFKCDDDVYLSPERLLKAGFENHQYVGMYIDRKSEQYPYGYMHGGAGYWLGCKAIDAVVSATVDRPSEDGWVANKVFEKGIAGYHSSRLKWVRRVYRDPFPETVKDIILSAEFTPEELLKVHGMRTIDPTDLMSADEYKRYLTEGICLQNGNHAGH
jgi:hypothetical protein